MFKNRLLLLLLVLCAGIAHAQMDKLRQAYQYAQPDKNNLDSARIMADAAAIHPETKNDPQTWYVRGYIYRELFKRQALSNKNIHLAEEAFSSCKRSIELDTAAEMKENNLKILQSVSATTNNTFAEEMDTVNYRKSLECLELQKKLVKYLRPKANIDSLEAYYFGFMGSYFQGIYEKSTKKNLAYLNLAAEAYNKVLIAEPSNVSANYNMGIIYYNQAVSLIMNKMDYDADISSLNDIQDEALVWFKKSLPYMEKAYQLNPRRKETLIGLSGIYYSLHENEKSAQFKKLSEDLDAGKK
jgi:hypothetical protein